MALFPDITQTIGRTPLIKLQRLGAGLPATIALKGEFFNPLGSVKDRIGRAMIEAAEKDGVLKPGMRIIEATSGNTGIALAFVAAAKGYALTLTMPDSMSQERRVLLAMLGARLVLTPAAEGMKGAMARAGQLAQEEGNAWIPQQFDNPANPDVHRRTTAEEIWADTGGRADVLVAVVGTGGTITGVSEVLKSRKAGFTSIAVEPATSAVIQQTRAGEPLHAGPHKIQGAGAGFIPKNLNLEIVDGVVAVTNEDAIATAQRLAREEGLLAGISTGANVWAALQVARRPEFAGKLIVTIGCSTGERYLEHGAGRAGPPGGGRMTALELFEDALPELAHEPPRRSLRKLLQPLFRQVAEASHAWRAESVGFWETPEGRYWMPRLVFRLPGEQPDVKLGIFAGVHGDEPAGVHALCDFVRTLEAAPLRGHGYLIHVYPLVNPTGYEDNTRTGRCGKDLNREFWRGSAAPEVALLEREILREKYHGFISLHSDDTSEGVYGFARGHTMTEHLLKPALAAVDAALPVNRDDVIDGFHAVEGIIHRAYDGILAAPPNARPQPFEIILETPTQAPLHLQRAAFVLALGEILAHYRRLLAYGGEL